jgi:hypothetical protein
LVVKLHSRDVSLLSLDPLGPEFVKATVILDNVAAKYQLEKIGNESSNEKRRSYVGGDFVGTEKSVYLRGFVDKYRSTLNLELTDLSCGESDLTKSLYTELYEEMRKVFLEVLIKPEK